MDIETARSRIEELRKKIELANYSYYVENEPKISDAEWDSFFDELKALEEEYPSLVTPDSPTHRVADQAISTDFRPVKHSVPMLSLDKANTEEEVKSWDGRIRRVLGMSPDEEIKFACEPKYDGLSIELIYRGGILETGSTRGDGFVGEDVTPNVRTLRGIPQRLAGDPPSLIEVRGEVYLPIEAFQNLNKNLEKEGKPVFSNPRNSAAGSLRQKDPQVTKSRPLKFFAHGIGSYDGLVIRAHSEALACLKKLGLPTTDSRVIGSLEELLDFYNDLLERRSTLPY